MATIDEVKSVLESALQLGERALKIEKSTALLGSLPELDSIAVVSLITAIEEHFDIIVEDDEITAETFATLGSLCSFVEQKLIAKV